MSASARIVVCGVALVPWRPPEVERALVGGAIATASAEAALAGATPLAQNEERLDLVRGLFEAAVAALA